MSVKQVFNQFAHTYDQARRQLIPCFEEFYGMVVSLIPYAAQDRFRVLDLGAGTGLLSMFVSEAFPNARLTLLDFSEDMLAKARARFADKPERIDYFVADYAARALPGKFDVVLSSLSIHHIPDRGKRCFFRKSTGRCAKVGYLSTQTRCAGRRKRLMQFTASSGSVRCGNGASASVTWLLHSSA